MKKILLLGGSAQQIVAIEAAKKLGYYTVLCDYLPDNPGQYHADKFYLVSTIDKEAVLKVAQDEAVDGVLAYASDPAAPTAAYVAEKMGLPTNPAKAVNTLCNKTMFRSFLRENGLHTPLAKGYTETDNPALDVDSFRLPVIIKPADSSGSKGATVLDTWEKLDEAVSFALDFSRSKQYIIEEYIEKGYPYLIGGDVFVVDGIVKIWGLMDCHRDNAANPLVPVGKSYPVGLDEETLNRVKDTVQKIITRIGYITGPVNVELIVDKNNEVWPIDFGPRCGGNMIPILMHSIFGIDVAELSVCGAMGAPLDLHIHESEACFATYNLHSKKNGVFRDIVISEQVKPYITDIQLYLQPGSHVEFFDNATKVIGIAFFRFDNRATMDEVYQNIEEYIRIQVDTDSEI